MMIDESAIPVNVYMGVDLLMKQMQEVTFK